MADCTSDKASAAMGEIALMVCEEAIEDITVEDNVEYWKALLQQKESRIDGIMKECDKGLLLT